MDPNDKPDEQLNDSQEELDQSASQDAPSQENVPEDVVEEAPQDEPADEPQGEPEPEPPSRRENLRIQQVLQKLKQSGEGHRQEQPQVNQVDYRELIDAPDEVYDQLEQRTKQYGDTRATQSAQETLKQIESVRWESRLEMDAPRVASKFAYMDDKNDETFQPAIADSLNRFYMDLSQYDPKTNTAGNTRLRYAEFVEAIDELADAIAETKIRSARTNLGKQAKQTGIRPDGSSSNRLNLNKAPQDMTDAELEAVIARGLPK